VEEQRAEGYYLNEIRKFGKPLQISYSSTEDLRNFWPTFTLWRRYRITICQVNTVRKITFSNTRVENQSFWTPMWHCLVTLLILSIQLLSWHYKFITSYTTHSDL